MTPSEQPTSSFRVYKLGAIAKTVFGIAMGICVANAFYPSLIVFFPDSLFVRLVVLMCSGLGLFLLITFVHEMGHAISAWFVGYKVHMIAVWRRGYAPEIRKFIKIPKNELQEIGGFVLASPVFGKETLWKDILISIAGPLSTLLLALGLVMVKFVTEMPLYIDRALGPLAVMLLLDSITNLIPMKFGEYMDSDGLTILRSLLGKSKWTADIWAAQRAFVIGETNVCVMLDEEWRELRKESQHAGTHGEAFMNVMLVYAWFKTDPDAFVAIFESAKCDPGIALPSFGMEYAACKVLIGQYESALIRYLNEDHREENQPVFDFAQLIFLSASGDREGALKAVQEYREQSGLRRIAVPDEENLIFTAIEKGEPFPVSQWEPF